MLRIPVVARCRRFCGQNCRAPGSQTPPDLASGHPTGVDTIPATPSVPNMTGRCLAACSQAPDPAEVPLTDAPHLICSSLAIPRIVPTHSAGREGVTPGHPERGPPQLTVKGRDMGWLQAPKRANPRSKRPPHVPPSLPAFHSPRHAALSRAQRPLAFCAAFACRSVWTASSASLACCRT